MFKCLKDSSRDARLVGLTRFVAWFWRLTHWEPEYNIFVPRFRPITSLAVQGLKRIGQSYSLHSKKFIWLWLRIFCEWHHKWSSFWAILAHVTWPTAQPLGQSISVKFSLETRLEPESFEPLSDFLTFPVQKLWSKINKLINYLIN